MIRITVYAGTSPDDERPASVSTRVANERDVHEELSRLGHEWKGADYFPSRQVVITLDPEPGEDGTNVRALVREASQRLEDTGLL